MDERSAQPLPPLAVGETWPGEPAESRWVAVLKGVRRHAVVALSVNLAVVVPLSLLLALLSERPFWQVIGESLLVVFVFTNCNFLLLDAFYHLVWLHLGLESTKAYLALGLLILPAAGALGTFSAIQLVDLVVPGLLGVRHDFLISIGVLVTLLAGLAFFGLEDGRRLRRHSEEQLSASRQREESSEQARLTAEISALHAMIRPHFVFNTLNAIATLIPDQPEIAEETTLRLARLLRYVLEVEDCPLVPLETDLEVVRGYLDIQRVRHGDQLEYKLEVSPAAARCTVPALVLQPLVENAVRHGIAQRESAGYVRIRAEREDGRLRLQVADNGPGVGVTGGAGKSMRLLRNRLDRTYGGDYDMAFERDDTAGETRVELDLPAREHAA